MPGPDHLPDDSHAEAATTGRYRPDRESRRTVEASTKGAVRQGRPRSARTWNWPPPQGYAKCDQISEGLIYFMIVFAPWAFGTTEVWSMNITNGAGYVLGTLLLGKWWFQWHTGYRPIRWGMGGQSVMEAAAERKGGGDDSSSGGDPVRENARGGFARSVTLMVGGLTGLLLLYTLISAANARASFDWQTEQFHYRECIRWLPHSYDGPASWRAFFNYLAWACFFWALRDWLLGKTEGECLHDESRGGGRLGHPFPERLQRLLWVMCVNGAVLSLEMVIQRIDGTNKLLWFRETYYNRQAESQLGPFAYRANGAQYLNLIWPVGLGFWWALHRKAGGRGVRHLHHMLLACVVIMIVAPMISLSRGGVLVTVSSLAVAAIMLFAGQGRKRSPVVLGVGSLLILSLSAGLLLGWKELRGRMGELEDGFLNRERTYEVARKMTLDFPWYGTGPESFQPVFLLYKITPEEYAPGQVHNDWLETRITFGWVGFLMIVAALGLVGVRWFGGSGVPMSWRLASFFWLGMSGCLVHARWDLPFQVYAIALTFLAFAAVLFAASRR